MRFRRGPRLAGHGLCLHYRARNADLGLEPPAAQLLSALRARRNPDAARAAVPRSPARLRVAADRRGRQAETRPGDPPPVEALDDDGLYVHAFDEDLRGAVVGLDRALGSWPVGT